MEPVNLGASQNHIVRYSSVGDGGASAPLQVLICQKFQKILAKSLTLLNSKSSTHTWQSGAENSILQLAYLVFKMSRWKLS